MTFDLVYSGKFFRNGRFENTELGIDNGIIVAVGKNLVASKKIKLDGAVIPAGIDTHVHFRDPWETEKEDFRTGSLAALYGGTTTVFDMPNNKYPIIDYEIFENKLSQINHRSHVDFGLYSMFVGSNAEIIHNKSSGIKIFLGGSTNSVVSDSFLPKQVEALNNLRIPVVFHAELAKCLEENKGAVTNLKEHNQARPEACEISGASVAMASGIDGKVITHVTVPEVLSSTAGKAIREVTPHHILLNDSMDLSSYGKVNPPLRSQETQERMLKSFIGGQVDIISSDHAPHIETDKEEFQFAKSGIIGVETRIPLLLSLVNRKVLDLNVLVRSACENPARLMGLRKGKLEKGYLADLMSFRFSDKKPLKSRYLHSKNWQSPFEGFEVVFPQSVVMRGELVLSESEAVDDRFGMHVKEKDYGKDSKKD